ncbi:Cellobiose dehydrogenase [Madurella mycetomatis]|uniref:Cellobiose dehydrogenase n=1 Tax=Madurella mycetomatis TaxID=100816 RepID=A0A175VXE2_9PEZI|nr:Cellobiose dehydrogenase [Madurella mycetomatis]
MSTESKSTAPCPIRRQLNPTMGLRHIVLLALGGTQAWPASASRVGPSKRQTTTTRYCPGGTQICFSEFRESTSEVVYRIAIPDVSTAPFDVLLQIVAPIATAGWAGISWGGTMTDNPLTVGWPNGDSAVVSSRFATRRALPGAYAGATYAVLPTTTTNATHWQLDVLCRGCSQWEGGSLDPNGVNNLAWARSAQTVNTPSSNTSSFGIHEGRGVFRHDFSAAKIPQGVFDAVIYSLENPPSTPSSAASATSTPVTTLPLPPTSAASSAAAGVSTDVLTAPAPSTPSRSVIATRLTELPNFQSSSSSAPVVVVTTRVTQLPRPTSTSRPPPLTITTRITGTFPTPIPTRSTTVRVPNPPSSTPGMTMAGVEALHGGKEKGKEREKGREREGAGAAAGAEEGEDVGDVGDVDIELML